MNMKDILTTAQRGTHTYVIGQPGTGKSRALESWVMQDIAAGRGVGVIDPHGELFHNLLLRIANRQQDWKRVIILNPCDKRWTVSFNPLAPIPGVPSERIAVYLTDVVIKLWNLSHTNAPRMLWLLSNTFLALSELDLTLLNLPRFLLDRDFREANIPQITSSNARDYFLHEFPQSQAAVHQWVTPVLNKIGGLLFDPDIRPMLAGGQTINFKEVIDRKLILLVNLPKGILGEGIGFLMAAFLVARIQQAALSRTPRHKKEHFYLYLDEFQNYTTDNIQDILAESRKYALSLILAHQYLDQLSTGIRNAALNTAGTLISFRVGHRDATRLAKEIFPSRDFLARSKSEIQLSHYGWFPHFRLKTSQKGESWDHLAHALTSLRYREFWCKRRGAYHPFKHRTYSMPDPILTKELIENRNALVDLSGESFGRLKHAPLASQEKEDRSFRDNPDIPFWE